MRRSFCEFYQMIPPSLSTCSRGIERRFRSDAVRLRNQIHALLMQFDPQNEEHLPDLRLQRRIEREWSHTTPTAETGSRGPGRLDTPHRRAALLGDCSRQRTLVGRSKRKRWNRDSLHCTGICG